MTTPNASIAEVPPDSTARRAGRGAAWTMGGYAVGQALRFLGTVILSRLLFEEAFGLMTLIASLLQGFQLFTDIGIGTTIVQRSKALDGPFLRTAWTLQIARGLLLSLLALVLTIPLAAFYEEPQFLLLVPVLGTTALISGFASTRVFVATRAMEYRRLAMLEILSQLAALLVTIAWALYSKTVWALVAGVMVSSVLRAALSHVMLPGAPDHLGWSRDAARELIHFGRWMFFSSALTFLCMHSDRLILGTMIYFAELGVYGIGLSLVQVPTQVMGQFAFAVVMPVLSRAAAVPGTLNRAVTTMRGPILRLAGWSLSGLIAGGDTIVRLIYDERFLDAGWIVQLLAASAWFATMEMSNGVTLLSLGQAKLVAAINGVKLLCLAVLLPVGFHQAGLEGALVAYTVADVVKYLASVAATRFMMVRDQAQEAQTSLLVVVAAAMGWSSAAFVRQLGLHAAVEALVVFATVSLVWARSLLPIARRVRKQGLSGLFEGV